MQSYKITLPNYKPFTMITTTPPEEVPAAVLERFGVEAVEVVALVNNGERKDENDNKPV